MREQRATALVESISNLAQVVERIDALVARAMQEQGAPGVALAVTDRAGLLFARNYGVANLDSGAPVTADTLFEFGSIGKSFTAIVLLQLAEQGVVDLHAPVTTYLPWFQVRSSYAPITIHHLLTHTAGIIRGSDFSPDPRYEVWALRESRIAAPGVKARYSNAGYKLLGLLLEAVTGKPYAQLVAERIFAPLGMHAAAGAITHDLRRRLAVGYEPFYDDRPRRVEHGQAPAAWLETNTADGCLSATASDLASYLRMLLNRGDAPVGRILSEESFALMTSAHTLMDDAAPYGYGLMMSLPGEPPRLGHGGGMVGYISSMLSDPEAGIGVVVFTNAMCATDAIAEFALQTLVQARKGEPLPELPIAPEIDLAAYAGLYESDTETVEVVATPQGEQGLLLVRGEEQIPLEPAARGWSKDQFVTDHPELGLFTWEFGRNDAGEVVELSSGERWYRGARYDGPTSFATPPIWQAYTGHYRSHNPWASNVRVLLRKGKLWLSYAGAAGEELAPHGTSFVLADDPDGPERIEFDTIVDGSAWRLLRPGSETLYRFFTP